MKFVVKYGLLLGAALFPIAVPAEEWSPAGDNIRTEWAEKVTPENVHREYPRPQMKRSEWRSLNGLWEYSVAEASSETPGKFDNHILVPFAIESSLSGVGRKISPSESLWYHKEFQIPSGWKKKRVLLNFGAVDWKAEVYLNDIYLGSHTGGYTAFTLDITPYLSSGPWQTLVIKVTDCTDGPDTFQPRGKQVSNPEGIWYTQVTGIWQSVWIEAVSDSYIKSYETSSSLSGNTITITARTAGVREGDIVLAELLDGMEGYDTENPSSEVLSFKRAAAGNPITFHIPDVKAWSPDSPYLYGLRLSLFRNGKCIDVVDGYAAVREVSVISDGNNHKRMALNGRPLFQFGPLDQGWWPDGLYTAPSDEALKYDIVKTKELGFNMIRKHIKVEPARWYYYCDRLGMMVWQDMPSIADNSENIWDPSEFAKGTDCNIPEKWQENYYKEWGEIMEQLKSHACIVVWVPFNEAWGQFGTEKSAEFTKEADPTRLVNAASGGNFRRCGDILDIHHYPEPSMFLYDGDYVNVLGEYGGIGLLLEGHLWQKDGNWGYVKYKDSQEVTDVYIEYAERLIELIHKGFAAAVYTQTTDVEGEVNGLMTYDRKVVKMNPGKVREINEKVIGSYKDICR